MARDPPAHESVEGTCPFRLALSATMPGDFRPSSFTDAEFPVQAQSCHGALEVVLWTALSPEIYASKLEPSCMMVILPTFKVCLRDMVACQEQALHSRQ